MTLEPMAPPDLASLTPRDVVVAIQSASVGWVDLLMTSGQYQHMPRPPYCPGLEYAGVVAWRGADAADAFALGDAVLVDGLLAGPRSLGAYQSWGGFASYGVAPSRPCTGFPARSRSTRRATCSATTRRRTTVWSRAGASNPARRSSYTARRVPRGWLPCRSRSCSGRG